ncbi:MAG: anhydro-N-acetylmuramic acid kinase [Bacteroidales bacterium]|nr:anhydro-N-acetylmuramic acid kinase [Bacteroidales bacterium]
MDFNENTIYRVTGIMSGTSLDGMDMAACIFRVRDGKWEYTIEHTVTWPYTPEWKSRLQSLFNASAAELAKIHFDYGRLSGELAKSFHTRTNFDPILIASHGHTVFHDPQTGFSMQIGNGAAIAAAGGKPVVCDFRAMDVCLGGQGAPLVPMGDEILFSQYDACLNLGGFSNISLKRDGKRIAFDICPVNTVLNQLAGKLGHEFDFNGNLARDGQIIEPLLEKLNSLLYYELPAPKSLGTEMLIRQMFPILEDSNYPVNDLLRTFVEHISVQIGRIVRQYKIKEILLTGGGAHNLFLISNIEKACGCKLVIPDNETIEYKEALIFALLGLLRWSGKTNILSSATGAIADSCGGAVYLPAK